MKTFDIAIDIPDHATSDKDGGSESESEYQPSGTSEDDEERKLLTNQSITANVASWPQDVADSYGGAKDCATHDYFSYLKHLEHKSKRRSQINCQKHIL